MNRIPVLLICLFPLLGYAQQPDSILRSAQKPPLINPYKNLKTSLFVRGQYQGTLGFGAGAGFELRRFTSLREYFFFEVSYSQWKKDNSVANSYSQDCSYTLTSKSLTVKLGRALFGSQAAYVGGFFLGDVQLSETIPAQYLVYSNDEYVTVSGDVTPYIRQVVPIIGYNVKFKAWKLIFGEIGLDYFFFNSFKPLKDHWRVPNKNSGFITAENEEKTRYNIYASIHFKL